MSKPLTGKVALVTGGSRGLGAATVRLLAEQGADVAFTYVSSEKRARAVVDEVHGKGAKAVALQSDQADTSRAPALIDDVVAHFGGLDILVNNAAISVAGTSSPASMRRNSSCSTSSSTDSRQCSISPSTYSGSTRRSMSSWSVPIHV